MANLPRSASAARGRRRALAGVLLAAALCAGIFACVRLVARYRTSYDPAYDQVRNTWEGVPAALAAATRSDLYKAGAAGLTSGSPAQRQAAVCRITIDFLRSLTPGQVETLRRGRYLRERQLSPGQLRPFLSISDATIAGSLSAKLEETRFYLVYESGVFHFLWTLPPRDGGN